MNLSLIVEFERFNGFETLLEEGLHLEGIFCLRQNFEKFGIRQEEETREKTSL